MGWTELDKLFWHDEVTATATMTYTVMVVPLVQTTTTVGNTAIQLNFGTVLLSGFGSVHVTGPSAAASARLSIDGLTYQGAYISANSVIGDPDTSFNFPRSIIDFRFANQPYTVSLAVSAEAGFYGVSIRRMLS